MRILFLRPNSGIPVAPPPIGLMYLVGYLRQARPHQDEITVLDARSELSSDEDVAETIQKTKPDLVGITSFTMEAKAAHRYAALAKQHAPGCATIIGGPYGTSDSADALDDPNVDFTARGEGEKTLISLIERLEKGGEQAELKGIGYRRNRIERNRLSAQWYCRRRIVSRFDRGH